MNKNKNYLHEINVQIEAKEDKVEKITKTAQTLLDLEQNITKAAIVKHHCELHYDIKAPLHQVRHVMRRHMGLKYKLCTKLTYKGNSERNLVLRQQFALEMVKLIQQGKRIINVDETWIAGLTFIYRKWRAPGTTNAVPVKQVRPRISLIAACDSEGDFYLSFTQVNTDANVMLLYLTQLVIELERDRPGFRKDTVLQLDGASYHKGTQLQDHLRRLGVQVIFTGPHSYDASPCELFFAALKSGDLNPNDLPTGKR
jgi:hypothetical protein